MAGERGVTNPFGMLRRDLPNSPLAWPRPSDRLGYSLADGQGFCIDPF